MAVVKINAITVPEGAGPELEKRFANRAGSVDGSKGFLGFQLLRPVKGDDRYFVVTQWETEEDFQAWAGGPAREAQTASARSRLRRAPICWSSRSCSTHAPRPDGQALNPSVPAGEQFVSPMFPLGTAVLPGG